MKSFACLVIVAAILFVEACKKGSDGPVNALSGNWKLVKEYISPGGPGNWTNVENQNKYVQFNNDLHLRSNIFQDNATYAIKDSVSFSITNDDSAPDYYTHYASKTYSYRYYVKADSLTISPPCIEGCSMKFVKQK